MAVVAKPQTNGGSTKTMPSPPTEFFWEPFTTITSVRRLMDSFFDSMILPETTMLGRFQSAPQANIYEKDGMYTIECALPGYKKDDIVVEAKDNEVTISGTYSEEKADEKKQYRRHELRRGSFSRTIDFPQQIDPEQVVASLENGVLKITVRPLKTIASKKIPISTG